MQRYVLAIDQGTTSSRAIIFDSSLQIRGQASVEFPQHFPGPSCVEHDLNEIWNSVCTSIDLAIKKAAVSPRDIAAIGITNQRETTCLWYRTRQAESVCRAIVWQDRRTAPECEKLKKRGLEKKVNRITGLRLDPYFSATKLAWMLKNVSGAEALAKKGQIAFGTVDSYLLYRIAGVHRTDPSNASRTLLMNLKTCEWDKEMLDLFKIPKQILPDICASAVEYGTTKSFLGFPDGIPVTGLAGDQQAALFGQACFTKGSVKCTYGTGAFILANTGTTPIYSKHRLLTSVGWKLGDKTTYVLEGSAFIAGASVQWLRDGLQVISSSSACETLAASVPDSDGVVFVPALSGMGAPYWIPEATGLITGLTRRTTKAHLARATLEGIAFQVYELLEAMKKDIGKKLTPIKVDGGASLDNLLMQFQTDLLDTEVVRAKVMETTALGVAMQAGLAIGIWKDLEEIRSKWEAAGEFHSTISAVQRKKELSRWFRAVEAVKLLSKG